MKLKEIFSKFDQKRLHGSLKLTGAILILILIVNIVNITYSKYESKANFNASANVAFFVLDQGTYEDNIALDEVYPSDEPFIYTINVSNFKDGKRANVNIKYTISIDTTTNIPLSYSVYRNEAYGPSATNIFTNISYRQEDDMYFKTHSNSSEYTMLYNEDTTDQYTVAVFYPEVYKDSPDMYQGKIDLITVTLHAEQVV